MTNIMTLTVPASDGAYTEEVLPTGALGYINKTGKTQFRLSGTAGVDFPSDVLELYGGNGGQYAPVLTVEY